MARDNFTIPTKTALAKRAGWRCSFPGCKAVTVGPSEEDSAAIANTGEAAHISAAAGGPGARRYVATLMPEERSSIENGIWCCNTHAKLIDTDEVSYTIPMLTQWKLLAERRAALRQAYGDIDFTYHRELIPLGLAPESLSLISDMEMNERIGLSVRHSYLAEICGHEAADAVRDFLIEHARNAFSHGGAMSVGIEFTSNAITVVDDGAAFTVSDLAAPESRGGGLAYRALLETKQLGHASSRRFDGQNHVHIPFVLNVGELPRVNPCAVALNHSDIRGGTLNVAQFVSCDRAFVIAPDFAVYSDGPLYESALQKIVTEHPNVVLIFPNASWRVIEHYRQLFPRAKVETW